MKLVPNYTPNLVRYALEIGWVYLDKIASSCKAVVVYAVVESISPYTLYLRFSSSARLRSLAAAPPVPYWWGLAELGVEICVDLSSARSAYFGQ